eukprot:gene6431-13001_t
MKIFVFVSLLCLQLGFSFRLVDKRFQSPSLTSWKKSRFETLIWDSVDSDEAKNSPPQLKSTVNRRKSSTDLDEIVIATAFGGSLIGLVTGGLLDGALANGDAPWAPLVGAAVAAGGSYYATTVDGIPRDLSTKLFGQPVIRSKNSFIQFINRKVTEIKKSITNRIDTTISDIKNIPNATKIAAKTKADNIKSDIERKVDETIAEAKALPGKIQKAILKAIEQQKEKTKKQIQNTVDEIAATPEKLLIAASKKADEVVAEVSRLPDAAVQKITKTAAEQVSVVQKSLPKLPSFDSEPSAPVSASVKAVTQPNKIVSTSTSVTTPAVVPVKTVAVSLPSTTPTPPASKAIQSQPQPQSKPKPQPVQVSPPKTAAITPPTPSSPVKSTTTPLPVTPSSSSSSTSSDNPFQGLFGSISTAFTTVETAKPTATATATSNTPKVTPSPSSPKPMPVKPMPVKPTPPVSTPVQKKSEPVKNSSTYNINGKFIEPKSPSATATPVAPPSNVKSVPATAATAARSVPAKTTTTATVVAADNKSNGNSNGNGFFGGISFIQKPNDVSPTTTTPAAVTKPSPVPKSSNGFFGGINFTPAAATKTTTTETVKPSSSAKATPTPMAKSTPVAVKEVVKVVQKPVIAPKVEVPIPKAVPAKPAPAGSILSASLSAKLESIKPNTATAVDTLMAEYRRGSIGPDSLYARLVKTLGSKEKAFSVLPDLIGCLPRGTEKSALNSFYQTQA